MQKKNVYYLLWSWLCITAISCSKNEIADKSDGDLLTNQVEKIETFLAKGATKEIITDPSVPKIETSASAETKRILAAQVRGEIEDTYKKSAVIGILGAANHPRAFAVFKSGGTCGGYGNLFIKMDCEDRRPATSQSGWVGDSHIDGGDVYLDFCVIDDDYANYMGVNDVGLWNPLSTSAYGFLYLGETFYFPTDPHTFPFPTGVSQYFYPWLSAIRVFDNEDNSNDNQVYYGGNIQPLTYWLSPVENSQQAYVAGNTRLHFIVAPASGSGSGLARKTLPIPEYGLIGQFGTDRGMFNVDDEDTNNRNVFEAGGYYARTDDATGNRINNPFPAQTIVGGSNTLLYLSRVY